jgi:hypothetical protein
MKLWQTIADNVNREAKKYKTPFLPEHRVDVTIDTTPIKTGEAYCRIWLVEMRLAQGVEWFKQRYPVVHTAVRFYYGNEVVTIPYLAAPGKLNDMGTDNLDRVIQCNYPLTPLFPFNQGLVELQAGLFSLVASDPIAKFIKTMGRFSELLPVPELSSVIKLAQPVYQGIEDLLDIGERRLELGYQQTFTDASGGGSNVLRGGYFAAILAEEHQFNDDTLCVVRDSLKVGYPGTTRVFLSDSRPLEGYSYMLFRLEKQTEQDWESLTSIKELVDKAQDAVNRAVNKSDYDAVKTSLLPAIRTAIFRSRDVAKADRKAMVLKIEEELRQMGLQAGNAPKRSLYSIMQRPLPPVDEETQAELAALETLFRD